MSLAETLQQRKPGNCAEITAFGTKFPEYPDGTIVPQLNTCLVACGIPEEKRGSIIIPDSTRAQDEQIGQVCRIVAVSPLWYQRLLGTQTVEDTPQLGDIVFIDKWVGTRLEFDGVDGIFKFITDNQILGVIRNTERYRPRIKLYG